MVEAAMCGCTLKNKCDNHNTTIGDTRLALFDGGASVREIARRDGISVTQARDSIRRARKRREQADD